MTLLSDRYSKGLEATAQVQEQMLDLSSDKVNPLLQTYFLSFPFHPISQALARSVFLMSSLSYAIVLLNNLWGLVVILSLCSSFYKCFWL